MPAVLADHARIVDAPWPTLLRRVGDAHVLFVTAAFPNATKHHRPHGQAVHYEFDPSSYAALGSGDGARGQGATRALGCDDRGKEAFDGRLERRELPSGRAL